MLILFMVFIDAIQWKDLKIERADCKAIYPIHHHPSSGVITPQIF